MKRSIPRVRARAALLFAIAMAAEALLAGCAARVYQRERLLDPIMSFDAEARLSARRLKALEAREGSTGGAGGAGGGCACK